MHQLCDYYNNYNYYIIQVGYKLDEDKNWAINVARLKSNLEEARKHCEPRIMVVINPGNPTGTL